MPIMEFKCASCGHRFEELLATAGADGVVCPSCSGRELERLYSVFGVRISQSAPPASCDMDGGSCCGGGCGRN